jgi:regulator of sigma E protease
MSVLLLILGLILFILLVVVHEFGHFMAARRNGVEVEEFGIGFPPKVWSRKTKSGFLFSINLLPLGGFVRLKGEHDSDTKPGTYGAAKLSAKVQIMLAGVGMNLLTAFVLFTILAVVGMPKLIDNQFTIASDTKTLQGQVLVAQVESDSPASNAGLQSQDRLLSIGEANGPQTTITSQDQLPKLTKALAGRGIAISIRRDGEFKQLNTTLRTNEDVEASLKTTNPKGYLGIAPAEYTLRRSTWSAPIVATGTISQLTVLTMKGLGQALKGLGSIIAGTITNNRTARQAGQTQASKDVSGPVGIFFVLKQGSSLGIIFITFIIAYISLALAIMNILPLPALDGGRLYLTLGFHVAGKKLKKSTEELINGVGFIVLMCLIILITIVDIKRPH